jgi:GNAT superfamily N-acetyltransferase
MAQVPVIEEVFGRSILAYIPELARLRIQVFREYPYLYDGTLAYEEEYLNVYAESPDAFVALAKAGQEIVGASSAVPLIREGETMSRLFQQAGYNPSTILYFGESVLLPAFRGKGIGHRFFDAREAYGRKIGMNMAAFCSVIRPEDHPLKPENFSPLYDFWSRRGFAPVDSLTMHFRWKDIDKDTDDEKPMQFWLKRL